jgi:hypothetical protein
MLVQTIRKNAAKSGAPHIILLPAWAARDGEPVVMWALSSRTPTKAEIAAAVAQWKRDQAKNNEAAHKQGATPKEN